MRSLVRYISLSLLIAGLLSTHVVAQGWPANESAGGALPQYTPKRYPLSAEPSGQPIEKLPIVQSSPTQVIPKSSVSTQQIPTQRIPTQHIPAQQVPTRSTAPTKESLQSRLNFQPNSTASPSQRSPMSAGNAGSGGTAAKDKKKKLPPHYGLDFSVYRDCDPLPIDPRKPCNQCLKPSSLPQGRFIDPWPGKNGRPYVESEIGGCQCEKKNPNKKPMFSVYWPRPFSAKRDERRPGKAEARYNGCQGKQLNDLFDPLSTFKISKYKRCDNAFSGVGREHFGCLGESKFAQSYFNAPGDSGLHFPTGLEPIPAQYAPTPAEPVSYRYPESYNQRPPAYQARYQEPAEEDQSMLDKWGNSIKSLMRR